MILARAADRLTIERKLQQAVRTPARAKGIEALRMAIDLAHLGQCTPAKKALAAARRSLAGRRKGARKPGSRK